MLDETGSIMIHEYPKIYNTSMDFSFDSNEVVLFPDLLPEALLMTLILWKNFQLFTQMTC